MTDGSWFDILLIMMMTGNILGRQGRGVRNYPFSSDGEFLGWKEGENWISNCDALSLSPSLCLTGFVGLDRLWRIQ